jgi:beta-glucosidase
MAMAKYEKSFNKVINEALDYGLPLAETISGKNNPCGKLPISFPYHIGQQPCYYNYLPGWHCESYLDMPKTPLFVFGEGLSYTKFCYSGLDFNKDTFTLSVKVKNVGNKAGKEVVQVYFRDVVSSVMTPIKQLIAFEKIYLQPNEEKEICFVFTEKDFSLVLPNESRVIEKGEFEIMVGGSSRDEELIRVVFKQEQTLEIK